jgi:hypothetical protein
MIHADLASKDESQAGVLVGAASLRATRIPLPQDWGLGGRRREAGVPPDPVGFI